MFRKFLFRAKKQILKNAYKRADEIVLAAELTAQRMTYESEIMKRIQIEAEKIKQETIAECKSIKKEFKNV